MLRRFSDLLTINGVLFGMALASAFVVTKLTLGDAVENVISKKE